MLSIMLNSNYLSCQKCNIIIQVLSFEISLKFPWNTNFELDEFYQLIRLYSAEGRTVGEFMIQRKEDQRLFEESLTRNLDGVD